MMDLGSSIIHLSTHSHHYNNYLPSLTYVSIEYVVKKMLTEYQMKSMYDYLNASSGSANL